MQLETAFSRLSESFTAQRAQLDTFAAEQQVRVCMSLFLSEKHCHCI